MDLMTDERFMSILQVYWPIVAVLLAIYGYFWKIRIRRRNLKELLGYELHTNFIYLNVALPEVEPTSEQIDDFIDSISAISRASKGFSLRIYDAFCTSLDILSQQEKVFDAYQGLVSIRVLGEEISQLLLIEKRSESESRRLIRKSIGLWQVATAAISNCENALRIFNYSKSQLEAVRKSRGTGINHIRTIRGSIEKSNTENGDKEA